MSISKFFNKTFFRIASLMVILASVGLLFVGCGQSKFSDGPDSSDVVTGNGGLAVTKGDYLYFVNGYKGIDDVADTNHEGRVEQSAIYRVKLDSEGKVTENTQYDENGDVIFDKTKSLKNVELLASKVAGFEYTHLYIFGDYLYYTSPNHMRDKSGTIMSKYLNFYRVKIDHSGSSELIYSSDSEGSEVDFTMYQVDDIAYAVILDGEKLVIINNNVKNNSRQNKVIETDNVNSVSLPKYSSSSEEIRDIDRAIYYTVTDDDDSTTVALKKYDLSKAESSDVYLSEGESYEVKGTMGDYLYYTKTVTGSNTHIYASNLKGDIVEVSQQSYGSSAQIQAFALTDKPYETSILYTDGSSTFYKVADGTAVKFLSSNIISNIVKVEGDYVYYLNSSSLYRVNYTLASQTGTAMIPSGTTAKGDAVNNFSIDGQRVYYFVKYTDNYYMHYKIAGTPVSEIDQSDYQHFVGKLLEADYVSE